MDIISLLLVAVALSMDAMAVSITSGMIVRQPRPQDVVKQALFFGFFQFAMPVAGYLLVRTVSGYVQAVDHWIAFALLSFIGIRMIIGACKNQEDKPAADPFTNRNLFLMAVATSIDALAVGAGFAMADGGLSIWLSGGIIGVITFALSILGVYIGKKVGSVFQKRAEIIGGVILVGIGVKILLEHLLGG